MACDKLADNENNAITYGPTDSQGGCGRGKELNITWDTNTQIYKNYENSGSRSENFKCNQYVLTISAYYPSIFRVATVMSSPAWKEA
jgi:hypothetical protein